jgi:NADPH:quinone reductase-like Zn-dependent oxidoreductase
MFLDERQLECQEGERLLKVRAVGINRAECLHRAGKYIITRPVEGFLGL